MEQFPPYLPQALYGLGILLAGYGGSRWQNRRNGNGNGKWNGQSERRTEPTITLRECDLRHTGIERELKEGNRRMGDMERQVLRLNNTIIKHYEKT